MAAVDFGDVGLSDKISFVLSRPVRLVAASREEVEDLFRAYFGDVSHSETVDSMLQEFTDEADAASHLGHPDVMRIADMTLESGPESEPFPRRDPARQGASCPQIPIRSSIRPVPWEIQACGFYVVEEGQRVLVRNPDGTMDVIVGPGALAQAGASSSV